MLIDYLPGSPDGLHRAPDGSFWVPLLAKHPPITRFLKSPLLRALLSRIPEHWRPPIPDWGAAVKVGVLAVGLLGNDQSGQHHLLLFSALGDWVQVIKAGESDATRKAGSVMQCWNK